MKPTRNTNGNTKRFGVSLLIFGLLLTFVVPVIVYNAPAWYYTMPSVLPPFLWVPCSLGVGVIFDILGILLIRGKKKTAKVAKKADGIKKLSIVIMHENQKLLEDCAGALEEWRGDLLRNYPFEDVSFLRVGATFGLNWMRVQPERTYVAFVSDHLMTHGLNAEKVMKAGAVDVFCIKENTVDSMVAKICEETIAFLES